MVGRILIIFDEIVNRIQYNVILPIWAVLTMKEVDGYGRCSGSS
jgi:hypothetical protein